jgi:2-oxoglutarate dehydrogenase E2 component (dihydrolipoamide succinyltransferase)
MDVVMPQLGETVTEGTVVTWHKKTGEAVKADELLFDVETDKVAMEVPAPAGGVLKEILVPEGETVAVGTRLAVIEVAGAAAAAASVPAAAATAARPDAPAVGARAAAARPDTAARGSAGEPPLSPVVRRLLAEHDLDPSTIKGTGRDGRITREDVLAAAGAGAKPTPATAPRPPERKGEGKGEVVPLTRIRKQIGAHMVRSKATSPHVLQAVEVDFHAVEAVRGARGKAWRERE